MEKMTTSLDLRTYKRLQSLAKPFVDTESSVIDRLITFYEEHAGGRLGADSSSREQLIVVEETNPPNMKHTKLLNARFAEQTPGRINWNELVRLGHVIGLNKAGDVKTLIDVTLARMVSGRKEDEGYTYIADADFSIQGVDANEAWRVVYALAKKLDVDVYAEFIWRDKPGAAFPGKKAILSWQPENTYLQDVQSGLDEWNSQEDAAAYDRL